MNMDISDIWKLQLMQIIAYLLKITADFHTKFPFNLKSSIDPFFVSIQDV